MRCFYHIYFNWLIQQAQAAVKSSVGATHTFCKMLNHSAIAK